MKKQLFFIGFVAMATILFMTSCDSGSSRSTGSSSSDGDNTDQMSGTIENVTGQPVVNATVEVYRVTTNDKSGNVASSDPDFTTTTNEDGVFSFNGNPLVSYEISVYAPGYIDVTFTYTPGEDEEIEITITGAADISGIIINSQTGEGLANVTVAFSTNDTLTNADNGDLIVITDSAGYYEIEGAPVGTFRIIIEAPGNFVRILDNVEIDEGVTEIDDITSVTPPAEGSMRIVLTWGTMPEDIDSHLTGPDGLGGRFHVYFSDEVNADATVDLDVDDVYSYGPETITIHSFYTGTYRYSVHNYDDQTTLGGQGIYNSPALVEVFDADGLVDSFSPPTFTSGNTWVVFEINVSGSSASIVPVNTYTYVDDEDNITKK